MFFYFIFVYFKLFPVFDFGLAHFTSQPILGEGTGVLSMKKKLL